jgi:hypothetical protein
MRSGVNDKHTKRYKDLHEGLPRDAGDMRLRVSEVVKKEREVMKGPNQVWITLNEDGPIDSLGT